MNPTLRNIFLLIVFLPVLLMGQDLNYKVLNTFGLNLTNSENLTSPQSIGDLNNDGISEVVLSQTGVDSLFIVYLNKKAEVVRVKIVNIKVINNNYTGNILKDYKFKTFRVIGDLDNDGVFEIAVGNPGIDKGLVSILFLDNNGELKDYNIIDPYTGDFPFYTDLSPADGFGSAVFPVGDLKDQNSPNLIIQGYKNVLCDSAIEYKDTVGEYFDTIYNSWSECVEKDTIVPVIFIVKLNSDGTVKEYHKIELYENDTTPFQYKLKPLEVCNVGDIDGNGINDLIIMGRLDFYVVLFNEDYTVKSSNPCFFNKEFIESVFSAPGRGVGIDMNNTISPISDINMDGIPEFIISAAASPTDSWNGTGKLYVVYLDSLGKINKLDTIDSIVNMNNRDLIIATMGYSISNIGDVNNDGFSDILAYSLIADKLMINLDFSVNPFAKEKWLRLSLNGTKLARNRFGKENGSYFFNGIDNHISIEVHDLKYVESDFPITVSLWFKVDAFGDTSSVLYASDEVTDIYSGYWVGYLPNGKITAGYGDGQGNSEDNRRSKLSKAVIDTSSWHNVVTVFNGLDDIEIYIDGQLDSGTYSGSAKSFNVGSDQKSVLGRSLGHSSSSYHNGKIDELSVYEDLTKDQLQRLYSGDSIFNFYSGISIISIYPDSCLDNECVWPGDANFDGIVNSKDIIQIGSVFSQTSDKKRTMATTEWVEQTCEDWNLNQFNVNAKHSDSDGNGVVNFLDASIVEKNYSKVSFKMDGTVPVDPFGPPLYIISNRDTVSNQDSIVYSISLGDSATPAENVYGVSMTLKHEVDEVFGSINSASFTGSWLGTKNVDMIATGFPLDDGIDIGMARTDQTNRTGQGYLSTVKVIIPDNLGEIVNNFDLRLTDLLIKSYDGDTIVPNVIYGDPVVILNRKEWDVNLLEKGLKVYPNPNSGVFNIDSRLELDKIRIMDLSGRAIKDFNTPSQHEVLNLSGFEKGVYLIEIQSGNLIAYERVFVK